MAAQEHHEVLYHGNCTDGFAAFSLYSRWAEAKGHTVRGKPVAPHDPATWPAVPEGKGATLVSVFLDVMLPEEAFRLWESVSVRTLVIDHHGTSSELYDRIRSETTHVVFSTVSCAAVLTHQYLFPGMPVSDWIWHVDRVDRWCGVTAHDVALREYLQPIARLPVAEPGPVGTAKALAYLDAVIMRYSSGKAVMLDLIAESEKLLAKKKQFLDSILVRADRTNRITVDAPYCAAHCLDPAWAGQVVFSVDTTGARGFDTTLAAHMVFTNCPGVTAFANYTRIGKGKYKFCVRSTGFDMTGRTKGAHAFSGHPCAAGGVLEGAAAPFLV